MLYRLITGLIMVILSLLFVGCGGSSPSSAKGEEWNTKVFKETFISFQYPSDWMTEENMWGQIKIIRPDTDKELFYISADGISTPSECIDQHRDKFKIMIKCGVDITLKNDTITRSYEAKNGRIQVFEGQRSSNGKEFVIVMIMGFGNDGIDGRFREILFEGFPSKMEENRPIIKRMIESIQPRPT